MTAPKTFTVEEIKAEVEKVRTKAKDDGYCIEADKFCDQFLDAVNPPLEEKGVYAFSGEGLIYNENLEDVGRWRIAWLDELGTDHQDDARRKSHKDMIMYQKTDDYPTSFCSPVYNKKAVFEGGKVVGVERVTHVVYMDRKTHEVVVKELF